MKKDEEPRPEMDDAPPLLGSWRNIYLTVVGALALYVVGLWVFSRIYA
jgi:hypothetical protein